MHYFRLYLHCLSMDLRTLIQRRGSFFLGFFGQILVYGAEFLLIWLLVSRFSIVGGWKAPEILLLFSFNLASYGIAGFFFFSSVRSLGEIINRGELDLILTKPLPALFGLIAFKPNLAYIAHLGLSLTVMFISLRAAGFAFTAGGLCFVLLALAGATLIQASIFMVCGSLNFWSIQAGDAIWEILWGVREFVKYPLTIYPGALRVFLTFILPLGFISYYPASRLLGKASAPFSGLMTGFVPLAGLLCFALSYGVWRLGLRRYESTGS